MTPSATWRAFADHSLGAVFAAQLIEHLPYSELLRFVRAARDKLVPGGLLVVETVNPHAAQALKNFWIDPTHRHPLFPETVIALCGLTGFAGAYVWHPQGIGGSRPRPHSAAGLCRGR